MFSMMMFPAAALFVGMFLGLRFKVVILGSAITVAIIATIAVGTYTEHFWSLALIVCLVIAALEVGYFAGTIIATARIGRASTAVIPVTQRQLG